MPEVMQDRRRKLAETLARGEEAFVADGRRDTYCADAAKEAQTGSTRQVALAGRLMAKRSSGGIAFLVLEDESGRIQVVLQRQALGEVGFARWLELDVGDLIRAEGALGLTRRGEPSVFAERVRLLTKSLRPLPEKWHGLKDIEIRYRQRYLDLIANPQVREVFRQRSRIIDALRRQLVAEGFLEVETPILHEVPGGGNARPFATHHHSLDREVYLRIALELHLKRLVVGGLERVFEIGRVFRNEGIDARHNPEFTLLECYQAYSDLGDMMELSERLISAAAGTVGVGPVISYQGGDIDLSPPYPRRKMQDLVEEATGERLVGKELQERFEKAVEATLRQPVFVTGHPIEVSPLARRNSAEPEFADRFELIIAGREMVNAFSELTDPVDQRRRFEAQALAREAGDLEAHPFDEDYVRALEFGMPPTGGLGLGVDRLVMLLTGKTQIRDVLLFPVMREEGQ